MTPMSPALRDDPPVNASRSALADHPDLSALLSDALDVPDAPSSASSRLRAVVFDLADAGAGLFETLMRGADGRRRWVLRQRGPDFDVLQVRRGRAETVGVLREGDSDDDARASWRAELSRAGSVELRLDPDHLLRRTLTLPAESQGFLKAIVEHRLDRLTPWTADNVVFGYRVAGRASAKDIAVDFVATSRSIARDALARAAALGLQPTAMGSAADPVESAVEIDLLSGRGDRASLRRRRAIGRGLMATAVVSLLVYLVSAFASSHVRSQLETVQADLDAERRSVVALSAGSAIEETAASLIAAKTLDRATFHILDGLADVIPDGTFLTEVEIRPTVLRLKGRSLDAPALVALLETRAGLSNVRFEAPVIREAGGGDRFAIVATPSSRTETEGGQP